MTYLINGLKNLIYKSKKSMILIKNFNDFILEGKKIYNVNKKLIDQFGKYKIYTVNGEKVRDIAEYDEEFGLSYSYFYFPKLIPKNEIWIEDDVKKDEIKILIYIELYKIKLIDDGMDKWDAYHKSEKMDKKLREKIDKNAEKTSEKGFDKVYKKEYCKIKDGGLTVWLVDGKIVRNKYKSDFMEGGNGCVYKWVPNDEIWIEDGLKEHEIPFVILHEFVEKTFMKEDNMKYDDAHNIAAKVEWSKRPDNFNKKDAENLTEKESLSLGNKFKN